MKSNWKSQLIFKKIYFSAVLADFNKYGYRGLFKKVFKRLLKEIFWLLLLPVSLIAHMIGFRRLLIRVEHIGHLAAEPDTFIKAMELGFVSKNLFYYILAHRRSTSNNHLVSYWKKHFKIVTNSFACTFLEILTRRLFMRCDLSPYISNFFGPQEIYRINKIWADRPHLLQLTAEDYDWGNSMLEKIGLSKNDWFVCLHVREGGFLPQNELIQSHRNASVANYMLAVKEITRRGGVVLRMGDPSMTPLDYMDRVIDYAHHPLKSDRLDLILCARAKFFLGCSSGLSFLSMIFGVPIAHANMIPVETLGIRSCDISIPKLLVNESDGKYLNFNQIFASSIGGFFFTYQYKEAGVRYEENTPKEILELTKEMLDRLESKFIESDEDRNLHMKYMRYFKKDHYSYEAVSKVNIAFLKKYRMLFY